MYGLGTVVWVKLSPTIKSQVTTQQSALWKNTTSPYHLHLGKWSCTFDVLGLYNSISLQGGDVRRSSCVHQSYRAPHSKVSSCDWAKPNALSSYLWNGRTCDVKSSRIQIWELNSRNVQCRVESHKDKLVANFNFAKMVCLFCGGVESTMWIGQEKYGLIS